MKGYKALVIDGRKIATRGALVLLVLVVSVLVGVNLSISRPQLPSEQLRAEKAVEETVPAMNGFRDKTESVREKLKNGAKTVLSFFMSFDITDPRTVIFGEVPFIRTASRGYLARTAEYEARMVYNPQNADTQETSPDPANTPSEGTFPIKEINSGQEKTVGKGKIFIRNETNYAIDTQGLLNEPLAFSMKGEGPKILIVHTHATESYAEEGSSTYDSGKSDRNDNTDMNVVRIGEEMKRIFEEKGISVIHDKTLHDKPNFNGSYENSRKTVERYLQEYPGITVVLDIHRDAFVYEDGSKAKFVTEIDGKKVAQLMFVVGTDAGGLYHPEWRENIKLALKFQKCISDRYPDLMRGVNLRKERFNGHTTKGSMIIEVGSSGNTLSEALEGAKYAAYAMADFLNSVE